MRRLGLFAEWGAIAFLLAALSTWPPGSMVDSCQASEIVFLTWNPSQPEVWERLIDRFHHENPGIRVRVQVGPHSSTEYHAIVAQRLKNQDPSIDIRGVSKHYGEVSALAKVDLQVADGELCVILGPSGCGKRAGGCFEAKAFPWTLKKWPTVLKARYWRLASGPRMSGSDLKRSRACKCRWIW